MSLWKAVSHGLHQYTNFYFACSEYPDNIITKKLLPYAYIILNSYYLYIYTYKYNTYIFMYYIHDHEN